MSQVYAPNWMRLEGNELIDVDTYREIVLAVSASFLKLPQHIDLSSYFLISEDQGLHHALLGRIHMC